MARCRPAVLVSRVSGNAKSESSSSRCRRAAPERGVVERQFVRACLRSGGRPARPWRVWGRRHARPAARHGAGSGVEWLRCGRRRCGERWRGGCRRASSNRCPRCVRNAGQCRSKHGQACGRPRAAGAAERSPASGRRASGLTRVAGRAPVAGRRRDSRHHELASSDVGNRRQGRLAHDSLQRAGEHARAGKVTACRSHRDTRRRRRPASLFTDRRPAWFRSCWLWFLWPSPRRRPWRCSAIVHSP